MPTKEVLQIEGGYSQETLLVSVDKRTITIHNLQTDATHFCLTIGAADWERVKNFVDSKLKSTE